MFNMDTDMVMDIYNSQAKKFDREKFFDKEYSKREEHLKKCIEDLRESITPEQKPTMDRLLGAIQMYDDYIMKKSFGNGMKYMYELGMILKNKY
ncbi:MAG: hypothetical protein E7396_01700 [Ruminococcaceae bacterium]|nr:hypothetical protein [Oscillospiraceae bacterium]